MKVLQLGKFYPPYHGGIETVTFDITEYLNQHQIKTDVLCSNDSRNYSEETYNNYKIYRTKSFGVFASVSLSYQYIKVLKKIMSNYDIIHVHLPNPLANLALFIAKPNQKVILHWHSDIIKQKFLLKLYSPLQNWMLKRADTIITTSPKYMRESKVLQPYIDKCSAVPIGIDNTALSFTDSKVLSIKEKYANKKIVFSLGRMIYYKGFQHLINSSAFLDDTYIILIGGKGELFETYSKMIKEKNLENKVVLLGRVDNDEIGSYFEACDLFCLPSIEKSEAFGVVQIEAMSFGKPIVATKIEGSGVDWVNENNFSGLNVEAKNPKALADAFISILENESSYLNYSSNALFRFNELFKRDRMGHGIVKIYSTLFHDK